MCSRTFPDGEGQEQNNARVKTLAFSFTKDFSAEPAGCSRNAAERNTTDASLPALVVQRKPGDKTAAQKLLGSAKRREVKNTIMTDRARRFR